MDSKRGYIIWFELFMEYCFVDNCTIQFHDFSSIARATMKMAGKKLGTRIGDDEVNEVLDLLRQLPVHDGVQGGLSQLRDQGYKLAALTNSPEQTVLDRMEPTGLISYFEMVLSAEHVRKYKPCIEVYEWAAKKLDASVEDVLMVSTHGWDITGAANAGMRTAYIQNDREMLYPLAPQPDFNCRNLADLVAQLNALDVKLKQEEVTARN
jgi:2-haloacid dehalogenase